MKPGDGDGVENSLGNRKNAGNKGLCSIQIFDHTFTY